MNASIAGLLLLGVAATSQAELIQDTNVALNSRVTLIDSFFQGGYPAARRWNLPQ